MGNKIHAIFKMYSTALRKVQNVFQIWKSNSAMSNTNCLVEIKLFCSMIVESKMRLFLFWTGVLTYINRMKIQSKIKMFEGNWQIRIFQVVVENGSRDWFARNFRRAFILCILNEARFHQLHIIRSVSSLKTLLAL